MSWLLGLFKRKNKQVEDDRKERFRSPRFEDENGRQIRDNNGKTFDDNDRRRFIEKCDRKDRILRDALVYLKEDLKNASDMVESTALNDMVYDIEVELKIPQNERVTTDRVAKAGPHFDKKPYRRKRRGHRGGKGRHKKFRHGGES